MPTDRRDALTIAKAGRLMADQKWPADKVERRNVADLIPYARNSRTHSAEQVGQIAASIKEWGWTVPVLIEPEGGLIAGHGRILAAQKLGIKDVPCMVAEGWTDAQKKAYVIADNKLALNAGWDDAMLKVEMGELDALDFDLSLTGFGADEIAAFFVEETEGLTDDDAVPDAPAVPVTALGDVWLLGRHRLMCGDSTSIDAVDKLMDGQKIDLVFTSPPYNQGGGSGDLFSHGKRVESLYQNDCDNKSKSEYFDFCISVFNSLLPHLSDSHSFVWNVSYNAKSRDDYGRILFSDQNPFSIKETIVWNKGGSINLPQVGIYSRKCEFIFVMSLNDTYLTSQKYGDCRWNYWETKKINQRADHKATFSVEMSDMGIIEFSFAGNHIYEPFGGSGTTLISCEKHGRFARLMELDPKYCDVIITRWQNFTGQTATLETTGQQFAELQADRVPA